VCAWFAVGIRQARDINRAAAIVSAATSLTPREASAANSLLKAAGTLNPDSQVDMVRAEVAMLEHRSSSATRIVESIVRREPMNAEAWVLLARAAYPNAALLHRALRHIALLDPKG